MIVITEKYRVFVNDWLRGQVEMERGLTAMRFKALIRELQSLGSFSIDDGDGNYNATNKQFHWSSEENKRAARVARTYEQVRAILCKTTTWNYNVYRFQDNLGIQMYSFNSLYLIWRRTH